MEEAIAKIFSIGLFIVVGHNKWAFEIPVIITLYGWGMVIKSSIYLLFPQTMAKVVPGTEESFRRTSIFAGGLMTPFPERSSFSIFISEVPPVEH